MVDFFPEKPDLEPGVVHDLKIARGSDGMLHLYAVEIWTITGRRTALDVTEELRQQFLKTGGP